MEFGQPPSPGERNRALGRLKEVRRAASRRRVLVPAYSGAVMAVALGVTFALTLTNPSGQKVRIGDSATSVSSSTSVPTTSSTTTSSTTAAVSMTVAPTTTTLVGPTTTVPTSLPPLAITQVAHAPCPSGYVDYGTVDLCLPPEYIPRSGYTCPSGSYLTFGPVLCMGDGGLIIAPIQDISPSTTTVPAPSTTAPSSRTAAQSSSSVPASTT